MPALPLPPPSSRSANSNGIPVTTTTSRPSSTPGTPALAITCRSSVLPSAKAKNGISAGTAAANSARSCGSRLPSAKPTSSGSTAPRNRRGSNTATPALPRMSIVINGPDSTDISTTAPASPGLPYCCMSEANSPPLVMSIAATRASTEMPFQQPCAIPSGGSTRAASTATSQATPSLVSSSTPDWRRIRPLARSWIEAPMHRNHTARIGTTPPIRPWLNEPRKAPACGHALWQAAPRNKGTSIMPPGMRSSVCLICIGVGRPLEKSRIRRRHAPVSFCVSAFTATAWRAGCRGAAPSVLGSVACRSGTVPSVAFARSRWRRRRSLSACRVRPAAPLPRPDCVPWRR